VVAVINVGISSSNFGTITNFLTASLLLQFLLNESGDIVDGDDGDSVKGPKAVAVVVPIPRDFCYRCHYHFHHITV
jgi:hypothetical protein